MSFPLLDMQFTTPIIATQTGRSHLHQSLKKNMSNLEIFCLELGKNILFGIGNGVIESPDNSPPINPELI